MTNEKEDQDQWTEEEIKQFEAFDYCVNFAMQKHKGQIRLDGEDYINHPFRVHDSVCAFSKNLDICYVAVLHDILEDTDTTFDDINNLFGKDIAHSVSLLTKPDGIEYDFYISTIKDSGDQNAINVKIADLKDNLSTIENIPDPKKRERLKKRYKKALKILTTSFEKEEQEAKQEFYHNYLNNKLKGL